MIHYFPSTIDFIFKTKRHSFPSHYKTASIIPLLRIKKILWHLLKCSNEKNCLNEKACVCTCLRMHRCLQDIRKNPWELWLYHGKRRKNKVTWDLVSEGGIFRLAVFIALCKLGLIWLHAVETWLAGGEMGPSRWTIMGLLVTTRLLQLPFPMGLHWGPKPRAPRNKRIRLALKSLAINISQYPHVHTYIEAILRDQWFSTTEHRFLKSKTTAMEYLVIIVSHIPSPQYWWYKIFFSNFNF